MPRSSEYGELGLTDNEARHLEALLSKYTWDSMTQLGITEPEAWQITVGEVIADILESEGAVTDGT
jgi:hypothetical protein